MNVETAWVLWGRATLQPNFHYKIELVAVLPQDEPVSLFGNRALAYLLLLLYFCFRTRSQEPGSLLSNFACSACFASSSSPRTRTQTSFSRKPLLCFF